MLRFRNIGKDINTSGGAGTNQNAPEQYRCWITNNEPDFDAYCYKGPIGGSIPLLDIETYAITDDNVVADFNLPLPTQWQPYPPDIALDVPIRATLPYPPDDAALVVIDNTAYIFGGKITNQIMYATNNNPCYWTIAAETLPSNLYGASLAVVGDYIYLFGGNNGNETVNTIYSAPTSNPLNWSLVGTLPVSLQYSSLMMRNGFLYLIGGLSNGIASNIILKASASSPLSWLIEVGRLPDALYGSTIAQIGSHYYLFGGMLGPNNPTNGIWSAGISDASNFTFDGYSLPYATAFSQFFTVGISGYLVGPMVSLETSMPPLADTGFTPILSCLLSAPTAFTDTNQIISGVLSHGVMASLVDRIWMFGGSGETAIFTCNQNIKYSLYDANAEAYANATRVVLPATNNALNPFLALCFPYWLTDYLFLIS